MLTNVCPALYTNQVGCESSYKMESQLSWESICLTSRGSQVRALQVPLWRDSSVGQSTRFIPAVSRVQIPLSLLNFKSEVLMDTAFPIFLLFYFSFCSHSSYIDTNQRGTLVNSFHHQSFYPKFKKFESKMESSLKLCYAIIIIKFLSDTLFVKFRRKNHGKFQKR